MPRSWMRLVHDSHHSGSVALRPGVGPQIEPQQPGELRQTVVARMNALIHITTTAAQFGCHAPPDQAGQPRARRRVEAVDIRPRIGAILPLKSPETIGIHETLRRCPDDGCHRAIAPSQSYDLCPLAARPNIGADEYGKEGRGERSKGSDKFHRDCVGVNDDPHRPLQVQRPDELRACPIAAATTGAWSVPGYAFVRSGTGCGALVTSIRCPRCST